MKLSEFKTHLSRHPDGMLRFLLPGGREVPVHAHVTEVARIDKRFIDCGGALHTDTYCRLQLWVADDLEHRLLAGKLSAIIAKAESFLGAEDHEVDAEYEDSVISQYPVETVSADGDHLVIRLTTRHTDCLAKDRCMPAPAAPQAIGFKTLPFKR